MSQFNRAFVPPSQTKFMSYEQKLQILNERYPTKKLLYHHLKSVSK